MTSQTGEITADTRAVPPALIASILILAKFFGVQASEERLIASVGADAKADIGELLAQAGLVGTVLPAGRKCLPTEMPALLVGLEGMTSVVLSAEGDRFECCVAGVHGVTWLDDAALKLAVPDAAWMAVRPILHFDQRSLLYALPQAGRWFWDCFDRNRGVFAWALLGTLALNLFGALIPIYSMAVYDRVIPNNAMGSLGVLTSAVVLLIVFEGTMRLLRSHMLEAAARRMDVALSARVYAQCLDMRSAERPASGGVLANTVRDFESIREFFATSTLTVLGDLPFMVLYLIVIALVGGWLVTVPLAVIPMLIGVALLSRGPLARKVNQSMQASSQRTAHLFEIMNGLDTVKSLGASAWSRRKWEGLTQTISQNSLETREITSRVNYANAALLGLANVAVVALGAILIEAQNMTLGQIIAVSLLTGRALNPASQVAGLMVRWQQTRYSYAALEKVMNAKTDDSSASIQAPLFSGNLEFKEVSFSYPNCPPIIERLSISIQPGERVGFIGKLGSGKSSLIKLVLNQIEPSSGSVVLDGLVNTQLEPQSLRRQMGYVPQDVTLFHGTIRENVELGRVESNDEALLAAVRHAGLDEIISQLPQGIATQVGERGDRLSGGQRQLVALARALLGRPRLLLLDEPSSMLDPATEQKIIGQLRALPKTTVLIATHRLAMLALVDRIVVMDRGRIVADGPKDVILKALEQKGNATPITTMPRATV